jgi:hypothetical protein
LKTETITLVDTILKQDLTKKVPFLKAKDIRAEFESVKDSSNRKAQKSGDNLLRRILASLAKGRADDQRAVADIAKKLVELGLYGKSPEPVSKKDRSETKPIL